jgi:hypothetical protein
MIKNPTRIIADPTRFDLLHVPDIGYRYDDRFRPEHAKFLGRYQGPTQVPGHRALAVAQQDREPRPRPQLCTCRAAARGGMVDHRTSGNPQHS